MASQSLASLVVDLKLETAQLKRGADDAVRKLSGFEGQLNKLGKSLSTLASIEVFKVFTEATKKLGEFVMGGAEAADKMNKLSQSVGISVETLSRFDYAMGLSGLSTDQLGTALGHLNKNMAEAAAGSKEQASAFRAIGVAVVDAAGNVRSTEAVIGDLAERFSSMEDGANKTAFAMKIFGKSGAEMIPFLNQGKEGIKALTDEADRLGITMSSKTARDAEAFNDAVEKLQRALQSIAVHVAGALAPALTSIIDKFLRSKDAGETFKMAVTGITAVLKALISAGVLVGAAFEGIGKTIARVASAIANFASGNFEESLRDTAQAMFFTDLQESLVEGLNTVSDLWKATGDEAQKSESKKRSAVKLTNDALADQAKKLAEARAAMEAELKIKFGQLDRSAAKQKEDFSKVAPTGGSIIGAFREDPALKKAREEFGTFNDTVDRATTAMKNYEAFTREAKQLEAEGYNELAQSTKKAADMHLALAENARTASDTFAEAARRQAQAVDGLINHFMAKTGRTGEVASAAGQGFQAGGWWGAIIAAVAELVSGSQQFADIIKVFDGFLEGLGNALGDALISVQQVLAALEPLLGMIVKLVGTVVGFANATHEVDAAFSVLTPIFNLLGNLLEPIGQFIDMIKSLVDSFSFMDFIIKIVATIFNAVSLTILGTIRGLQEIWKGILSVVRDIMKALLQNTDGIDKMIEDNNNNIRSTEDKMKRIVKNISDPNAAGTPAPVKTLDNVGGAASGAADSLKNLGETADEVSAQLTNVPTGYKVATARFLSTLAESSTATIIRSIEYYMERKSFVQTGSTNWKGGG